MTDLLSFFKKNAVIRRIRSNSIIQLEPAMQLVSEGDEKHEGSAAPWAEGSSWPWSGELLGPCRGTQHRGMPCQAPAWLCQGTSLLATEAPEASTWTVSSDVQFCDVPNTEMKRRPIRCWHHALSTNSKINWVGTNSVSPGLFLLPLMSFALIQLLLINFHQV